ncbi:MAG: sulfite exporter TauE/SafE family protein [Tannerellaceae bacterium]|jgi:sulfite exporter TauE/SafE|nr:sulfite exporter TauE/SafE family protein [Tannerellaceae bacterium]
MNEQTILLATAASLGCIHTLLGPDHYLPFIVLSKAQGWTMAKTMWITFISGIAHVASSVLIGMIGVGLGASLHKLESVESWRGGVVSWALFLFGVGYTIYGIYKYVRHSHHAHLPIAEEEARTFRATPWIVFLIFFFGPCEVLIPLLFYPASERNMFSIFLVALVFAIATIGTMLVMVFLGYKGFSLVKIRNRERYVHLLAGLIILVSAGGMLFLGW